MREWLLLTSFPVCELSLLPAQAWLLAYWAVGQDFVLITTPARLLIATWKVQINKQEKIKVV